MIVTEKEAKKKWCHRMPFQGMILCEGALCMAWKWVDGDHPIPVLIHDIQSQKGRIVCDPPAARENPWGDHGIWMMDDQEKRRGCCGLVYTNY